MGRRKRKYKPKDFESTGQSNDTSANIYDSMILSPAFMDLSKNQKLLYIYMKAQYYGKRKPGKDFPEVEQLQGETLFYFNMALAENYGIYTRSNHKAFYADIKAVEDHGFIETISNGSATKSRSIYKFSSRWQAWNKS